MKYNFVIINLILFISTTLWGQPNVEINLVPKECKVRPGDTTAIILKAAIKPLNGFNSNIDLYTVGYCSLSTYKITPPIKDTIVTVIILNPFKLSSQPFGLYTLQLHASNGTTLLGADSCTIYTPFVQHLLYPGTHLPSGKNYTYKVALQNFDSIFNGPVKFVASEYFKLVNVYDSAEIFTTILMPPYPDSLDFTVKPRGCGPYEIRLSAIEQLTLCTLRSKNYVRPVVKNIIYDSILTSFTYPKPQTDNSINSFYRDVKGRFWFGGKLKRNEGTDTLGAINVFCDAISHETIYKNIKALYGVSSTYWYADVTKISGDKNGNVFFSLAHHSQPQPPKYGYLVYSEQGVWSYKNALSGNTKLMTNFCLVDPQDRVWFAADSGVACLTGAFWSTYPFSIIGETNPITDMDIDIQGNVWLGREDPSVSGVTKYDQLQQTWNTYNADTGGTVVIACADDGDVFVTVNGVLFLLNKDKLKRVSPLSNSSSSGYKVWDMLVARNKILYMATDSGIVTFDKSSNTLLRYNNFNYNYDTEMLPSALGIFDTTSIVVGFTNTANNNYRSVYRFFLDPDITANVTPPVKKNAENKCGIQIFNSGPQIRGRIALPLGIHENVILELYTIQGRRLDVIRKNGPLSGIFTFTLNSRIHAQGTYLLRVSSKQFTSIARLVTLR